MRIIAGSARGRRLATLKDNSVRPTPDRVREALFSMLQSRLGGFNGLRILDLFAGSGALAIEALSRGAASATLIEKNTATMQVIRDNLKLCRLEDNATLLCGDAWRYLPTLPKSQPFDLIFLDPPYNKGMAARALTELAQTGLLAADGIICVETASDEVLPEQVDSLEQSVQRRYGTVTIALYQYSDKGVSA
ncbi:MAG: 16S rRNA (guanine(966)-N(2))-methyltransferase RsmD [Desulfuromonadales bacterium]|nr:16S rRNA (guanine(966)-N(2))-methyltransferase RsmD [Desulfuromonadales bacterium]